MRLPSFDGEGYNASYVRSLMPGVPAVLINLSYRLQGFYVQKGNPKGITGWQDLARDDLTILNRRPGSSSRILLDVQLKKSRHFFCIPKGVRSYCKIRISRLRRRWRREKRIWRWEQSVFQRRSMGSTSSRFKKESYDLVVRKSLLETSVGQKLEEVLMSPIFHRELAHFTGNDYRDLGKIIEEV